MGQGTGRAAEGAGGDLREVPRSTTERPQNRSSAIHEIGEIT